MLLTNILLPIKRELDFGIIDKDNNTVVGFEYDILSKIDGKDMLKGVNVSTSHNSTTIFSKNMKKLIAMQDMNIDIKNDFIVVYNDQKQVFITNDGEIKTAKDIFPNNKLYAISKNEKWGYEDKNGEIKTECIYTYVTEFNRFGFAGVCKQGKWGVIYDTRIYYSRLYF